MNVTHLLKRCFYATACSTVCAFLALHALPALAGQDAGNGTAPKIENVGFMKDPPKELREKFPMCDAFLEVEWIDKEKMIGFSRYSLYAEDGTLLSPQVDAIIYVGKKLQMPTINYSTSMHYVDEERFVFPHVGEAELPGLFSLIKRGSICSLDGRGGLEFGIRNSTDTMLFDRLRVAHEEFGHFLAYNSLNVCVPYPDNQRMWIAELKIAKKIYNDIVLQNIKQNLANAHLDPKSSVLNLLEWSNVFDLNFDGKVDYIIGENVIYSVGNAYYKSMALFKNEGDDSWLSWSYPPWGGICKLDRWFVGVYITTDGKNYFLNDQCNLTELTKGRY